MDFGFEFIISRLLGDSITSAVSRVLVTNVTERVVKIFRLIFQLRLGSLLIYYRIWFVLKVRLPNAGSLNRFQSDMIALCVSLRAYLIGSAAFTR